jgi:hypothetical protein
MSAAPAGNPVGRKEGSPTMSDAKPMYLYIDRDIEMPRAVRRQLKALGEDPAAIVAAAAEPTSALHVYFEWDDNIAADLLRLAQAKALVEVVIVQNPEVMVTAATEPTSALHMYFEWDNNTAADLLRLAQARTLIARR